MTDLAPLDIVDRNTWGAHFVGPDVARFRLWAPAEASSPASPGPSGTRLCGRNKAVPTVFNAAKGESAFTTSAGGRNKQGWRLASPTPTFLVEEQIV